MKELSRRELMKLSIAGALGAAGTLLFGSKVMASTGVNQLKIPTKVPAAKTDCYDIAMTLLEQSKMRSNDPLQSIAMELYAKNSNLLQYLPFETIPGNALAYHSENESGQVNLIIEALIIGGADLDHDANIEESRGVYEALKIKSLSCSLTKTMIKGDVNGKNSIREFNGFQVRCKGKQLINNNNADTHKSFLGKINELTSSVHKPTHLLMDRLMRKKLRSAVKFTSTDNFISYKLDFFGKRIMFFNNIPIITSGIDLMSNKILDFTEKSPFEIGNNYTSIYCLSLIDDGIVGIQNDVMQVRDLGKLEEKPVLRTRIEWYPGMVVRRENALARLCGITNVK